MNEINKNKLRLDLSFLGKISWEYPKWPWDFLEKLKSKYKILSFDIGNEIKKDKKKSLKTIGLFLSGIIFVVGSVYWYANRPEEVRISVSGTTPALTEIKDDIVPDFVYINFGASVARLDQIGKKIKSNISIHPKIRGNWAWNSDKQLKFMPLEDWGIGQEYEVEMEEELFPDHIKLEKYSHEFLTAKFDYSIIKSEFYIDPKKPDIKKIVVTVSFTHPVDVASFEKRVHMRIDGEKKGFFSFGKEKDYPHAIFYNKYKSEAYIHSDNVDIPMDDVYMLVNIDEGIKPTRKSESSQRKFDLKVVIPGMYNYFKISSSELTLVRNEMYEPEQVLVLQASAGVLESEMQKALEAYELPRNFITSVGKEIFGRYPYQWRNVAKIGPEVLSKSIKLDLKPLPTEREYSTLHSFKYKSEPGKYIYIRIKKGLKCYGDFILSKDFDHISRVPNFPKELKIMADGSILSLSGKKKISIISRDIDAVRFKIGRVFSDQINHLISQSYGDIKLPRFKNWNFNEDNIIEEFTEVRVLNKMEYGKTQYSSFDLSKYLYGNGGKTAKRGLFYLTIEGWDPIRKTTVGVNDKRLVLITDMGILVKNCRNGSRDVFVQSIHTGRPVSSAKVQILGKNGIPVFSALTDSKGHVKFPALHGYSREKTPTVYLVRKGSDFSFIPYSWNTRKLGFSRFDVGGTRVSIGKDNLQAYLFSDRGIYRPGDKFHIGAIIKSGKWSNNISNVPLKAIITDPRGIEIMKKNFTIPAMGFYELEYETEDNSPTGKYNVKIYIIRDGYRLDLLGSTSIRVEEFLPDRMRIATKFSENKKKGWVSPADLKGLVSLKNLFGTPAQNRKVKGSITLSPGYPAFKEYPGYIFLDPIKAKKSFSDTLEESITDDEGEAEFNLGLEKFEKATYHLNFIAEGYEQEGGRGVVSESSILVSPLPYLIGHKADGNFKYISKNSDRFVDILGVNSDLSKIKVSGIKLKLLELKYVSALMRQPNRTYKYQSVEKEVTLNKKEFMIPENGLNYKLPTGRSGSFALVLMNSENLELCRIPFYVAGKGNLTRSLDRNAELEVRLNKNDYDQGETIEIHIKAPYTGAGLITIERDKVYEHKWFKSATTAFTQKIKLPAKLQGNGYINVTFLRDPNSSEVFMSPLSYGVVPFTVSRKKLTEPINIECKDLVLPGNPLKIKYSTVKKSKIIVFGVDEGILQVARYKTPDPLGYFFKKRALEVDTFQILDLILPEFDAVQRLSSPGGDRGFDAIGKNLNPFKRKRDKPVVFWSGILDADSASREFVYNVPDYFNGSMKLMAVAVTPLTIGVSEKKVIVRGPFILSPNVPTTVAPGDKFDVSVGISNNLEGSGKDAQLDVEISVSNNLEVTSLSREKINISEGSEGAAKFTLLAKDKIGASSVSFKVSKGDKKTKSTVGVSLRPALPYITDIFGGYIKNDDVKIPINRSMYPNYRILEANFSTVPLGLARGLLNYLRNYPYSCTEQIVSQSFPAVVLLKRSEFGYAPGEVKSAMNRTIKVLRSRQNAEGAFGFWAANSHYSEFQSVYAMHFLTVAREKGYKVPAGMIQRGVFFLGKLLNSEPQTLSDVRARAYAAYILARNGIVTSGRVGALRQKMETKMKGRWEKDLSAIYLAATYKLMKQHRDADRLIKRCKFDDAQEVNYSYFYDDLVRNSQLLYILAKHFPERLKKITGKDITRISDPIIKNSYNTLSSAYAILAFDAYLDVAGFPKDKDVTVKELLKGGVEKLLLSPGGLFPVLPFSHNASAVKFSNESDLNLFYQVTVAGFDLKNPENDLKNKIEVQREYRTEQGEVVDNVEIGSNLEVHIKIRSLEKTEMNNVAIVDMLPGGFEIIRDQSLRENSRRNSVGMPSSRMSPEYVDIREDRIVVYGSIVPEAREFVYRIRATNAGVFTVPPVFAESMYDRSIKARSSAGKITVK